MAARIRRRWVGVGTVAFGAVIPWAGSAAAAEPLPPDSSSSISGASSDEPGPAYIFAEGFGRRADQIITFENLIGYDNQKEKYDSDTSSASELFASKRWGLFPSRMVRFGYHHVFESLVTVGSGLGFWYLGSASESQQARDNAITQFELRPRVGLAIPASRLFGIWPRVGASLLYRSGHDYSAWMLSPSVDLLGVFTPVDHFGLMGGLTLDIGAAGKAGPKDEKVDARYQSLGFTFGLLADF